MKKKHPTALVQTRIDTPVHARLLKEAREEGISVADYVRRLILRDHKERMAANG